MELNIKVDRLTMYQHICSEFEKKEELDCRDKAFVCRIVELCQKKSKLNEEVEKKEITPKKKPAPTKKRGRPPKTSSEKLQKKTKKRLPCAEKKPKPSVVEKEDVSSDEKENPTKDVLNIMENNEAPTPCVYNGTSRRRWRVFR